MNLDQANGALLALRREFDAGFAQAPRSANAAQENLLAIRVGPDGYALRIDDIGGLHVGKPIVPMPTPIAELKGMAGFRGRAAPVYDLAGLLGYPLQPATRWMVLARGAEPVALAFERFEGHFSIDAHDLVKSADAKTAPALQIHATMFDAVRHDGALWPIIDIPSLISRIQRRIATLHAAQTGRKFDQGAFNHE
jgi:purine-binding chemotaxis protein CheW